MTSSNQFSTPILRHNNSNRRLQQDGECSAAFGSFLPLLILELSKIIMIMKPTPSHIKQAHKLLHLTINSSKSAPTTKEEIQRAYHQQAQIFHPDSQHPLRCPARFRECHDARQVLLDYYSRARKQRAMTTNGRYAPGFPSRTLRVLTVRQNLTLRLIVMTVVTLGVLYDDYFNKSERRERRRKQIEERS